VEGIDLAAPHAQQQPGVIDLDHDQALALADHDAADHLDHALGALVLPGS
jgi:hypothetical protein